MCGFCNVWVCVCVGFVMCGCVYVCVLLCVGVCMCGCFGNMYICLSLYCFVYVYLLLFVTCVRTTATE